jgi:tetratricopeptide (TPR) repeat protein
MLRRLCLAGLCVGLAATQRAAAAVVQPDAPSYWLSTAQSDAAQLTNPAEKAGVLTTIAYGWAALGDAHTADQAADQAALPASQIPDSLTRFNAYMALAGFRDQGGEADATRQMLDAADAAVQNIAAGPDRQNAADQLRQFRAIVAGFAPTRKIIDAQLDPADRAQNFAALADGFARAGPAHHDDFNAAVAAATSAADLVTDDPQKQSLKSLIVQTDVRGGDIDDAMALAQKITDPAAQATAAAALAQEFVKEGKTSLARDAILRMVTSASTAAEDHRAAIWLNVARAWQAMGDKAAALTALDSAAGAAAGLAPADRADVLAASARIRADLSDAPGSAVAVADAATAAQAVTDPVDCTEVWMAVAAAQARCGMATAAQDSLGNAQLAAQRIAPEKRHPEGDPSPQAMLELIQAAAAANDFGTAQTVADGVSDPHLKHDAALAIAGAEVNLAQYQAAEDTVQKEGSPDSEAAICGIIAASLARTRNAAQADQWIDKLTNASDKVAARLAVAQVLQEKPPATQP